MDIGWKWIKKNMDIGRKWMKKEYGYRMKMDLEWKLKFNLVKREARETWKSNGLKNISFDKKYFIQNCGYICSVLKELSLGDKNMICSLLRN